MDMSARAVELARARLRHYPSAQVVEGCLPQDWPEGQFDLIVISEWAYYLEPALFIQVIKRLAASLTPDGAVLACHWLQPIDGCPMQGADAHALLTQHLPLTRTLRHEETDFVMEMWSNHTAGIDLSERVAVNEPARG
jgi:SAM-dependent methyltransferase